MQLEFSQVLIIGLIGLLFAKDYLFKWLGAKLGFTTPTDELQGKMDYLKLHFNDELTSILTELQVGQKEQRKILDKVMEHLDDMRVNGIRVRS